MSNPLQVHVFREQLNRLIDTYPNALTNRKLVKGLAERGCVISLPYLSQLRTGARTNPSHEVVDALAGFFDVPPGHFFVKSDPKNADEVRAEDARVVGRIGSPGMRALLRLASDLSEDSQDLLVDLAAKLRICDQLAMVPPDSHDYVLQAPPHPRRSAVTVS
ncbi:helix-turn-helix domain-containing protein [Rhodococcus qingshengii]|uniref:helix-turn-helix domain-containing protein n=1 Tax=Rhodococcus qingshengii TaxID=334542 RepID=UPI0021B0A2B5|nr:transcriptional regulator [Rhodococcus qingshengii]MCT6735545.1 transcriptional regulator [Rhodococcus qingshengii]